MNESLWLQGKRPGRGKEEVAGEYDEAGCGDLFEDDNGNNWYNGVITSVVGGVYTVQYDSDTKPRGHKTGAFSKGKFNEHWYFAK